MRLRIGVEDDVRFGAYQRTTSNNLTKVIMKAVQALTTMLREEVAKKMIAFGASELLDPCMNDFEFQFDCL
jgi:hypothetical protein